MSSERRVTALGPLPRDWDVVALGDVLRRVGEPVRVDQVATYMEIGIRSHGKGIFHKAPVTGASLGNKRVFGIVPQSLVFNIVFAWEGAVAVTTAKELGMIASHRFPMFRPTEPPRVDVEFLRRFFQSKLGVQLLGDASPGGAGRNRTLGQKLTAEIPLPLPPITEQRKIAAILSSIDDAIEASQAVIDQLQVVKKAMMAELLTRGIPGRHTRFKVTKIGEVPEEWDIVKIGDIAEVTYGLTVNAQRRASTERRSYLTVANLQEGGFDLHDVKTIGVLPGDIERYALSGGDILVVEGNANIERLGTALQWRGQLDQVLHQNHLIRVRITKRGLSPDWVELALGSNAGRLQVRNHAKTSSGLHTINSRVVSALVVPVPTDSESTAIASSFAQLARRRDVEIAALSALRDMKSALMAVLLTGEVRVQPDGVAAA